MLRSNGCTINTARLIKALCLPSARCVTCGQSVAAKARGIVCIRCLGQVWSFLLFSHVCEESADSEFVYFALKIIIITKLKSQSRRDSSVGTWVDTKPIHFCKKKKTPKCGDNRKRRQDLQLKTGSIERITFFWDSLTRPNLRYAPFRNEELDYFKFCHKNITSR